MFLLTDDQIELKRALRAFVREEIAPVAAKLDESGAFPSELMRAIAKQGYFGVSVPQALGGAGGSLIDSAIVIEELSCGLGSLGLSLCGHMLHCCYALCDAVSASQKLEWLIPAVRGEMLLALALTEASGGCDALSMDTAVSRIESGWVLNGTKSFVTNAGVSDGYLVAAKTDRNGKSRNLGLFYVRADTPGLRLVRQHPLLGFQNTPVGAVEFDGCVLPPDARIGGENEGYRILQHMLNCGRMGLSAVSIGLAQAALKCSIRYSQGRGQMGRTISTYQGVTFPIADMYTGISAARAMLYHVASRIEIGCSATEEAAALKVYSTEVCRKSCQEAALLHGGMGMVKPSVTERLLRDCQSLSVAGGTTQICKTVIANGLYEAAVEDF